MNHLNEEQLILHYYGEEGDALAAERHLDECGECRALYGSLQRVLNVVDTLPIPDMGPEYGARVWQRIERRIPVRRRWWLAVPTRRLPGCWWRLSQPAASISTGRPPIGWPRPIPRPARRF
jgi:hypothetical protein